MQHILVPTGLGVVLGMAIICVLTRYPGKYTADTDQRHKKDDDAYQSIDDSAAGSSQPVAQIHEDEMFEKVERVLRQKLPTLNIPPDPLREAVRKAQQEEMEDDVSCFNVMDNLISICVLLTGLWALDQITSGGIAAFLRGMFPDEMELLFGKFPQL